MSSLSPPPVDPRSYEQLVQQTEELLERYAGWRPVAGDPGAALVRVFARMAGRVSERLNRVPDRTFLAFLDLVGVEPRPPEPARVPLTFSLAAGARRDAVVPARTPVAGQPLEGETEAPVFETERELLVTRTTLDAVVVHEPASDRWADRTAGAAAGAPFAAFAGEQGVTHRFHLSHPLAFGADAPKTVRLRLAPAAGAAQWPGLVEWSWRGAEGDTAVAPDAVSYGSPWELTFTGLPAIPLTDVGGAVGAWLSARLRPPLLLRDTPPAAVLAGGAWAEPGETVFPFGTVQLAGPFVLSSPEVFGVAGATALLEVELDPAFPAPEADEALRLEWEYHTAAGWRPLGASTPGAASAGETAFAFSDGTQALTRSGTVTFRVPPGWVAHVEQGASGTWLQVRAAGGYGGGEFRPPAVRRVALGYDLAIPEVGGVQARVELSRRGLLPAAGAAGAAELDLSKDFLPFGARPALGDAFYLALPQLVDRVGAAVKLGLTLNPFSSPPPDGWVRPTLRWEFWDAATARWQPFGESRVGESWSAATASWRPVAGAPAPADFGYGFSDATLALTAAGGARVDVRFAAPALGQVVVNGRRDAWIRVRIAAGDYAASPTASRPPSVHTLELDVDWTSPWTAPDTAVVEDDWTRTRLAPAAGGALPPFVPFVRPEELRPALYLGFRRPGEAVGFANRAVTLYLGVAAVPFGGSGEAAAPAVPARVAWEYWNGEGWARLEVIDESAAFARRGVLTFVGPADFFASARFGREAFWLRAVPEGGGWAHPPRLEQVLLNTVWAEHAARVRGEVLGSGSGQPGQHVRTARAPVLPGERIEVREAEPPPAAELEALEREGGPGALSAAAAGTWVRWTAVTDFHGSGPASRHYVVDRATGEVRFGDGRRGRVPPRGRGNLRAAHYRTGGGPAGNRPAGNLAQLKATVPYVDRVTNPEPAAGGTAAETLDSVRARGPRTLRHRGRAVTLADLEDLAVEASPEVAVARAFGPRYEAEAGRVRVLLVPRGAEARPVPSLELLDRVRAHLAERLPAGVELELMGPEWVEVSVTAEVVPLTFEGAGEARAALAARLAAFLHPVTGGPGGAGWAFGRRPLRSDLYALVEATPGVDHVRRLEVREAPVPRTPWFLVHSGTHEVRVAGLLDED